jgi:hypothetical protein
MSAGSQASPAEPRENHFNAADVESILRERGWLSPDAQGTELLENWLQRAASLLGPHADHRESLAELLGLIFHYDAAAILSDAESHAVLCREGARDVIRELALELLDGGPLDSDRFKVVVDTVKARVHYSSRELFYPFRLALAGRTGGGELDRVILLIHGAAEVPGFAPVKNVRQRILEFCAAVE